MNIYSLFKISFFNKTSFDYLESPQASDSLSSAFDRFLFLLKISLLKKIHGNFSSLTIFDKKVDCASFPKKRLNELKVSPFLVERLAVFYFFFSKVLFIAHTKKYYKKALSHFLPFSHSFSILTQSSRRQ